MKTLFFKIKCLTNLHMGSGDVNFDVIDLEVERDPVLNEPTMNASGVKGALRDHCKNKMYKNDWLNIFGSDAYERDEELKKAGSKQGTYHFLSGDLIARPVRVSAGDASYVLATTPELLHHVGNKLVAFGRENPFAKIPDALKDKVLTGGKCTEIEGLPAEHKDGGYEALSKFLGTDNWVIMTPEQLKSIELPVVAHNVLEDGTSRNVWYEQYVPHESVFGLIVIAPENDEAFERVIAQKPVVQFGAGATTGCGFAKVEKYEKERGE